DGIGAGPAGLLSGGDRPQFDQIHLADDPLPQRDHDVAGLSQRGLAPVHEDTTGAADRLRVYLLHLRGVGADAVDVGARLELASVENWSGGGGGGADHVGLTHRLVRRGGGDKPRRDLGLHAGDEGVDVFWVTAENPNALDGADGADGEQVCRGLGAGADD